MIKNVALNKLVISPENVRVFSASKSADAELVSMIKSKGLLQNLVVVANSDGLFEVIAGSRRLSALGVLAKAGHIAKDEPVSCKIEENREDITNISLMENLGRAAMHPSDEYKAFAELLASGETVESISASFGVTENIVKKRLALGKVAPKLMKAYIKETISLKCLMAFTVVTDHKRQLACYKDLSNRYFNEKSVKSWLLGESVDISKGLGKYLGLDAYLAAGGPTSIDLFGETTYLSDTELVKKLVVEKLETEAAKLKDDGWMWISTDLNLDAHNFVQLQVKQLKVPKKILEAISKQQSIVWELDEEGDEKDWTDAITKKHAIAEEKLTKLELDCDNEYQFFTKAKKKYSGCLLSVSDEGKLVIDQGLANMADIPQPKKTPASDDNSSIENIEPSLEISAALSGDLAKYRQQSVKATLLKNPSTAYDILIYSLCISVFTPDNCYDFQGLCSLSAKIINSETTLGDTLSSKAFDELQAGKKDLELEWFTIDDKGERFTAFCALDVSMKTKLMTYCMSQLLTVGVRGNNADVDSLVDSLEVPFTEYWRPSASNYFSRLTKPQIFHQFEEHQEKSWSLINKDLKKSLLAANLETWINTDSVITKTWLPNQF